MIKLNITEEMIAFLKETMDKYDVKAAGLARGIKKTSAYISKFLAKDFKATTYEDLCEMVNAICNDKDSSVALVNEFLTGYILNGKPDIYSEDVGLKNFDDIVRLIKIPEELVEYINSELNSANITAENIVDRINSNADLDEASKDPKYEYNIYYYGTEEAEGAEDHDSYIIKLKVDLDHINNILHMSESRTNYLTMESILYALFRVKGYAKIKSQISSEHILNKYKFYNLRDQKLANMAEKSLNNSVNLLKNLPSRYVITIGNLIKCYQAFYEIDSKYIEVKNAGLNQNLNDDPSLFISLIDAPLYKAKDLDIDKKRKLIDDIRALIEKSVAPTQSDETYQIIK